MQAFDRPPWEIIQIHGNGVIEGLGLIFLEPEKEFFKPFFDDINSNSILLGD